MLKIALIGYGYWGSKLARNFQNLEVFKLISIADIMPENLSLAKKNYPLLKTSNDYKKTIKNNIIDLVIISSPTTTHYKICKFALENYKHVLVEKPLSLSLKEVRELIKIAKSKKKMIFVDYPFLFSGTINFIKEIINKNTYGKILEIESFREQAPIRKDVNVIWDLCTHDISILTHLLKGNPYSIHTIKKRNIKGSFCDTAYINLKYPNNLNVLIKNAWVSPTKIRLIKIKFEKAILYCDENESLYKIKIYKNKSNKLINYNMEIPNLDLTEPLSKLASYIHKSIKNNTNKLFQNKFNERITHLLEKINKVND
jgi:predicted dehydrogenase|tara:strand:- start:262 stop:1203 length:942 start_codon:yes stop_codon:yes gene_type:complete